jgi:NAD+ synthase
MGAPANLVYKVPTADLESNAPLRSDEDAFGVTYDQIHDFLQARESIPRLATAFLLYTSYRHKRAPPAAP